MGGNTKEQGGGEPVKRGTGRPGAAPRTVHGATGDKGRAVGGGTAEAATTDELKEIAARAREKYPDYDVGVLFGVLLRAVRKGTQTPVPVEETTEELLLDGIARQARMRQLAVQRARRDPVAACGTAAAS